MNYTSICAFLFLMLTTLVHAEIDDGRKLNKKVKILDKDVEDAKERWITNEEDWGDDDMVQHPIDEGPRRVSTTTTKWLTCVLITNQHSLPNHLGH